MTNLVVITAAMHKVADLFINVKYRCPGNVIKYVPVKFEVFREGEYFKALPVETAESNRLTNLPKQLLFQIDSGKVYTFDKADKEDVVEDIANNLYKMNIVECPQKQVTEKVFPVSSDKLNQWVRNFKRGEEKPVFFA
ncbi:hypothetical protein [Segetibacter koreensis]|uniref:hypothetical protein n=1 Tax=Segetibacter koreensis TaxID=398037 RepID=UPI0003784CBC|nr:hypothetical protein [Segetibacter koreensis]